MDSSDSMTGKYHSPDVDFVPGCSGKVIYISKGEGQNYLRSFKKTHKGNPKIYPCNNNPMINTHWHISTKGKEGSYRGIGK